MNKHEAKVFGIVVGQLVVEVLGTRRERLQGRAQAYTAIQEVLLEALKDKLRR